MSSFIGTSLSNVIDGNVILVRIFLVRSSRWHLRIIMIFTTDKLRRIPLSLSHFNISDSLIKLGLWGAHFLTSTWDSLHLHLVVSICICSIIFLVSPVIVIFLLSIGSMEVFVSLLVGVLSFQSILHCKDLNIWILGRIGVGRVVGSHLLVFQFEVGHISEGFRLNLFSIKVRLI